MALENITTLPVEAADQLVYLLRLFQAIGGLIIAYIIFNLINVIINRKKKNHMKRMANDIGEIKRILKNNIKKKK
ncbi:MAG: hypothetical protein ABIB79_01670 [archaeon]